jgi:hypothetical protein
VFKLSDLDLSLIGKTIYFKFTAWNAYGAGEQGLDEATSYSYTIDGWAKSLETPIDFTTGIAGAGKPADNATRNVVTYSASAPVSPVNGDLWVDLSGAFAVFKLRSGGAWQTGANALTAYNALSGKPVALSDINTTESAKLTGIEAEATKNAPGQLLRTQTFDTGEWTLSGGFSKQSGNWVATAWAKETAVLACSTTALSEVYTNSGRLPIQGGARIWQRWKVHNAAATGKTPMVAFWWYNAAGTFLSSVMPLTVTPALVPSGTSAYLEAAATAPIDAAFAVIGIQQTAGSAGSGHWAFAEPYLAYNQAGSNIGGDWATEITNRPVELTDGRIADVITPTGTIVAGKVSNSATNSASGTFNHTGWTTRGTVTLTPAAASSRIDVIVSGNIIVGDASAAGTFAEVRVMRGGVARYGPVTTSKQRGAPAPHAGTFSETGLTGSQTYTLEYRASATHGGGDPHSVDNSTITVTEYRA